MTKTAPFNAMIVVLLVRACYPAWSLADPSPCQTPPQGQTAKKGEPGVIVGELHFARRNEKGEWVRDPRRFATEAKQGTKKDAGPKKQEPAKPAPKNQDKTDFESQLRDAILPHLELEAQAQSWTCDYISGMSEAAFWEFKQLPEKLAERNQVQIQLRYDLFPTVKLFDGLAERVEQYRQAKESKSGKPVKAEALAREFGIFELKAVRLDTKQKQPHVVTFPGSLLADLKKGTLEVRLQCRTKNVFAGFHPDDLVILNRP
jgi:hypothetical protein